MSESTPDTLKRTPLYDIHTSLGARMVPFAGWEMPVQYPTGITAEHKAVRTGVGLFDVSHMGEFIVRGERALEFCNYMVSNDVSRLAEGQAQYAGLLNERGTFVDDLLVYRFEDRLMLVVNASNAAKDFAHILPYAERFGVELEDVSDDMALLALQGPEAERVLQPLTPADLAGIRFYHSVEDTVAGVPDVLISRTGYTGEAGFELYLPADRAVEVWQAIVRDASVVPCGLGARDTLRLEAGLLLYGNDMDDTVTPLEAGLGWTVKLQKGDFVGREALVAQKEAGVQRRLVGFTFEERAIARSGYPVFAPDGSPSGTVCSGTMSPTLGIPIGTCYLPAGSTDEGTRFEVEVRGKRVPAVVRRTPFYKRGE
jgi:aminomethyltransferase